MKDGYSADNIIEVWMGSGKFDEKNREIGYIVGFNQNIDGTEFAAWVQKGRKVEHDFFGFGTAQRAKLFTDQKRARDWAYQTAKYRTSQL